MREYVKTLNHLYLTQKELYEIDDSWDGFHWIEPNDNNRNVLVYSRKSSEGFESFVVLNFSPMEYDYTFHVDLNGRYNVVLCSDEYRFGGNGYKPEYFETYNNYLTIKLPAYGAYILQHTD